MDKEADAGNFQVTHRLVLSIALPMTLAYLTIPLLGLTDTAVAGHLGKADYLAGLALGALVLDLLLGTVNFLYSATTGLVAQAFGRGDMREQQAVFLRSLVLALVIGCAMAALSPLLLIIGKMVMGAEGGVGDAMGRYFSIRILGSPATLTNMAVMGFILGRGRGTLGLALQILINGVNIGLCILLGLWMGYGIEGIAIATVTGETLGALCGVAYVVSQFDRANPPRRADVFDRGKFKALFGLNRDILIRSFVLMSTFTVQARVGGMLGPIVLAGNALLMTLFLVAGYYMDGFANAAEQLVGRAIGAKNRKAFDDAIRLTRFWSFGLGAMTTALFLAFGGAVISGLTTVVAVQEEAMHYLPWAALTALTGALAFQMDGVYIGATWSRTMRNMMLASFAVYLLAMAVFVPLLGNHGLWLALNLFLLVRGLFLLSQLPGRTRQTFLSAQ
jgi:multidrug resistance protein, MATE family